jgi:hypothetical protein
MGDEHLFDGIYHIERSADTSAFPCDKLQILVNNTLAEKWYIPVKQDEALGVCLLAAIRFAQQGIVEEKKATVERITNRLCLKVNWNPTRIVNDSLTASSRKHYER